MATSAVTNTAAPEDEPDGIIVFDGPEPTQFSDPQNLNSYMQQYPEAENDQACRLFKYSPRCSPSLLMTVFSKFDYTHFSMFPFGLTEKTNHQMIFPRTETCSCEKCRSAQPCGKQGMQISLGYCMLETESLDQNDSLRMTVYPEGFSIHLRNKMITFRNVFWSLQVFRCRSRRLEHIEHAYDALVCHTMACETSLNAVPINYVLQQLREILDGWKIIIHWATEYLGYFRFEILEERLEYDRAIIRNLLMAARVWQNLRVMLKDQYRVLLFLQDLKSHPTWLAGSPELYGIQLIANSLLFELSATGEQIDRDLINDTNVLIQQITNLISIDEGYRSRDQNSSVKRLSWITFIFLPLVFAASIFGMNVDLFQNDPSWHYYLYLSIPLFFVIIVCYAVLKYKRRMLRALGRVILALLQEGESRDTIDAELALATEPQASETILRWAASAGRVDVVSTMANRTSIPTKSESNESGTPLLWAVRNGHQQIAEVLVTKTSNLNATDEDGATALHWAAHHGMTTITDLLLAKGANMHIKDNQGKKPQDWVKKGKNRTLRLGQHHQVSGWGEDIVTEAEPLAEIFSHVAHGDLEEIRAFHESGGSLELRDAIGRTVLFQAISSNQTEALKLLLNQGANIHSIDTPGFTPLHAAVEENNLEAVQILLDRGADPSAASSYRITPLLCVNPTYGFSILKLLVDKGVDINVQDTGGSTIAHAISKGRGGEGGGLASMRFIASKGAKITLEDNDGNTPAHIAAKAGNLDAMKFFKENGVDIETCRNKAKLTPLMVAVKEDQTKMVDFMLQLGISPHVDLDGRSLWDLAIRWGKSGSLSLLSKYIITVPRPHQGQAASGQIAHNPGGQSDSTIGTILDNHPVWQAIGEGHTDVVLQLLEDGNLDINMIDSQHISLLHCAIEAGNYTLVWPLLARGANPNTRDLYGWTPFHSAAFRGDVRMVKALLDRVEDKNTLDFQGWMALDLAMFYWHFEIVKLLDPDGKVKVFPWQIVALESRRTGGLKRTYSWNPDKEKLDTKRAEAP